MRHRPLRPRSLPFGLLVLLGGGLRPAPVPAQVETGLEGVVTDRDTTLPIAGAAVSIEGLNLGVVTDSAGRYRLRDIPPGPQVLSVEMIGYAAARVRLAMPTAGVMELDVALATSPLRLEGITVTADPVSRARGELGTASVIERDAIDVQTATSLSGLLELVPGTVLRPPGLDDVEQISLRTVPTSSVLSLVGRGPSPAELASFGTLIVLDGVPVSNNANLQSLGPRGELRIPTSAGGGIDLRRIPATTLERVEVIRGVPSVRFGDLSHGVIVVDTRAGAFEPRLESIFDPFTAGGSFVGGWSLAADGAMSGTVDVTGTRPSPGFNDNESVRFSSQFSHRADVGEAFATGAGSEPIPKVRLDTRVDLFQVVHDNPEDSVVSPGASSWSRDRGLRISERARLSLSPGFLLEFTGALDLTQQRSFVEAPRARGAMPFTDRVTEGRAIGRFIGGTYQSRVAIDGDVRQVFTRLEAERRTAWLGLDHRVRGGTVLRREWNAGPGYQFDIEFPPQMSFNGVQGFDRPRRFDDLDAVAASAVYLDDRVVGALGGRWSYDVQAGLRLDLLHEAGYWASGVRDGVLQPRLNAQLSPRPWLRLRAGVGRTAKQPSLGQLSPARQFYDVVNVNWFAPDPAERLAVLTTFIQNPDNPVLGFSRTTKAEAGIEVAPARDLSLSVTAFRDRTEGGVGIRSTPAVIFRDRYELSDSTIGTGARPEIRDPPITSDSTPVILDVPDNNLTLAARGLELTARLPQLRPLRTALEVQGALIETELLKDGLDFGTRFGSFQMDERVGRAPFWESVTQTGVRGLLTYRLVHHQPDLGLVITGTVQHFAYEKVENVAQTDTLAWVGYITRGGDMVRVPAADRGRPGFADLREPRTNVFTRPDEIAPDWFLSLQVTLDLPFDGRLSLWAFNALDRPGTRGNEDQSPRFNRGLRFGLEGAFRLGWLLGPARDPSGGGSNP